MSISFAYPRPEYPRPTASGHPGGIDWLNLNGPWQFRFDRHRRGMEEEWFRPDELEWREQIIVPFAGIARCLGEGDAAGNENYYATRVFSTRWKSTPRITVPPALRSGVVSASHRNSKPPGLGR